MKRETCYYLRGKEGSNERGKSKESWIETSVWSEERRRQTNEARTRNCSWLYFGVSLIFFFCKASSKFRFRIRFIYTYIIFFHFVSFLFLSIFSFLLFFSNWLFALFVEKGKNFVRCFWGYASRTIRQEDIVTWQLIGNLLMHPLSIAWIDAHFCKKFWKQTVEMYSIKFLESRGNYSSLLGG